MMYIQPISTLKDARLKPEKKTGAEEAVETLEPRTLLGGGKWAATLGNSLAG